MNRTQWNRVAVGALLSIAAYPAPRLPGQALTPHDSALHALNRLAYGPRPGEVERVARMGVMNWIEQQLSPERLPDDSLARRERGFSLLRYDRAELARRYAAVVEDRVQRQRSGMAADTLPPRTGPAAEFRRLAGQLQQLVVVRAALSERQLHEVMADFWTNHFNVFYGKGADRFLTPSYIEETIRPRALGRFDDLLIATARSPAMLFYLDNTQSVTPGSAPPPPVPGRARRRALTPAVGQPRMPRGINENYARELLELHTLGVDGGYTQEDVIAVARIFTGWGIARPREPGGGGGFEFRDWAHDREEKLALGERFPAGGGMEEGIRLLKFLAGHHATMHFVSAKLCARFVADVPPDGCVDDAVAAWHRTGGDIREILRAIFRSPDFWAAPALRAKVKTPLEFVVSAVRAAGGVPDTTPRLAQVVARLGQPLYLQSAPTGYAESQEDWVNSGALLERMNVAVALASARLPGVFVDLDRVLPLTGDHRELITLLNERILGGTMTEQTKRVIARQLTGVEGAAAARALGLGLVVGGPEFQRQ